MTYVIGYSEFRPGMTDLEPIRYKTEVFEITSNTAISEIYDYFTNPIIYVEREIPIHHVWGEESADFDQIPYTTFKRSWQRTELPIYPIILKWSLRECDSEGKNPQPLIDITTPLDNTLYYDG